jgi:hypothetical protein
MKLQPHNFWLQNQMERDRGLNEHRRNATIASCSHSGSIFSIILRLLSLLLSACLKNLKITVATGKKGRGCQQREKRGPCQSSGDQPRRKFNEPLGVYGDALVHVPSRTVTKRIGKQQQKTQKNLVMPMARASLLCRLHQSVEGNPFGILVVSEEQQSA